ncbi:MAG: hypothetical protein V7K27_07025 [Nostoc sp.]|uniref:hypothetical protein n=1 Tax=Nostoc sp. TaxID=1180 RepID=UPI002FF5869D
MDTNAERLRLSGIDERVDFRAAVESDRAVCGTSNLKHRVCFYRHNEIAVNFYRSVLEDSWADFL